VILEFVRSTSFPPGSNREGEPAPPAWLFLLASLEDLRPHSVGEIPAHLAEGISCWETITPLPPEGRMVDLPGDCRLLLIGRDAGRDSREREFVERVLRAGRVAVHAHAAVASDIAGLLAGGEFRWLQAASNSEPETREVIGRFTVWLPPPAPSPRARGRVVSRARRVVRRFVRRLRGGGAIAAEEDPSGTPLMLAGPSPRGVGQGDALFLPRGQDPRQPPDWLSELARGSEIDLCGHRWRLVPARGYRSQKVMFLTEPCGDAAGEVGLAVKITQDPTFNVRLENEHRGLTLLERLGGADPGTAPRAKFLTYHRGLAVVGETRIFGEPFRLRSDGSSSCPLAARALAWIEELGARTARPLGGADLAAAGAELAGRFRTLYAPDPRLDAALEDAIARLAGLDAVPTVFTHGDAGTWNLLVNEAGRVAFLDWENAEENGLPLADLFDFLAGYGAFAAERAGVRATPKTFFRQFLEESSFSRLLVESTFRYCARLDLTRAAVEPLLHLYWLMQSVREAWRFAPEKLGRGRAFRILRGLAERRDASPVLRRLRVPG
jgi:hypothetical protein